MKFLILLGNTSYTVITQPWIAYSNIWISIEYKFHLQYTTCKLKDMLCWYSDLSEHFVTQLLGFSYPRSDKWSWGTKVPYIDRINHRPSYIFSRGAQMEFFWGDFIMRFLLYENKKTRWAIPFCPTLVIFMWKFFATALIKCSIWGIFRQNYKAIASPFCPKLVIFMAKFFATGLIKYQLLGIFSQN